MHIAQLDYLNGSPFGGFQQVYSDQNNVWYVSNYALGNYESAGPYQSHASIFLVLELN